MNEPLTQIQTTPKKSLTFLTTITPLSKFIAVILFITLPFAGFLLGQRYPRSLIPKNTIQSSSTSVSPKNITPGVKQILPKSPTPYPPLTQSTRMYSPEAAQAMISETASKVINAIKTKDFLTLSKYVRPYEGLSLTAGVCFNPSDAQTFTPQEIKNIPNDNTVYMWGRPYASGLPVKKTISKFLYQDLYDHDFANSPEVHFNEYREWTGSGSNCLDDYFDDKTIEVEYYFPGTDEYAYHDGASLHLIFTESDNKWYLIHMTNQFWSP